MRPERRPLWLIYTRDQIRRRKVVGGVVMLPALAWLVVSTMWASNAMLLTAFFAVWFGACVGCMLKYRTERGLWMLAALLVIPPLGLYLFFWYDLLTGLSAPNSSTASLIDGTAATSLLWLQIRFLISTGYQNKALTSPETRTTT